MTGTGTALHLRFLGPGATGLFPASSRAPINHDRELGPMQTKSTNRPLPAGASSGLPLRITAAGFSKTGVRHRTNQDRFLIDRARDMFVIADGMGGMRAGERAAQMAVDLLPIHPALHDCSAADAEGARRALRQAFVDVNQQIVTAADTNPQVCP